MHEILLKLFGHRTTVMHNGTILIDPDDILFIKTILMHVEHH